MTLIHCKTVFVLHLILPKGASGTINEPTHTHMHDHSFTELHSIWFMPIEALVYEHQIAMMDPVIE